MPAMSLRIWHTAVCGLLALGMAALPAVGLAQRPPSETRDLEFGQDRFMAGDQVEVTRATDGDVIAAGGRVTLNADVAGDALVAGRDLRLAGPVQQGVLAAGREVVFAGTITRNARAAGATIRLLPDARIGRNATLAGRELDLQGTVIGHLLAAGRRIYINGTIGGDAQLTGTVIELGPDARIGGSLRYRSPNELKRAASAQVGGAVERLPGTGRQSPRGNVPIAGMLVWSLGLGALAALLLVLVPAFAREVSDTIRNRLGMSLLAGLIALVCIPVALVIALIAIIGIPVGLMALLAYPALLLLGYVLAGVALGDFAHARFRTGHLPSHGSRIIAAVIALLVLGLLAAIPVLGGLLCLMFTLAGMGALLLQLWKVRKVTGSAV
jgi:hypothetical protein